MVSPLRPICFFFFFLRRTQIARPGFRVFIPQITASNLGCSRPYHRTCETGIICCHADNLLNVSKEQGGIQLSKTPVEQFWHRILTWPFKSHSLTVSNSQVNWAALGSGYSQNQTSTKLILSSFNVLEGYENKVGHELIRG